MVENNDNGVPANESGSAKGRGRGRIFGARKSARKPAEQAAERPADVQLSEQQPIRQQVPAQQTAIDQPETDPDQTEQREARHVEQPLGADVTEPAVAEPTDSEPTDSVSADTVRADETASKDAADAAARVEEAPSDVSPFPPVLSTTSLIFHAPPVMALPVRADDDADDEEPSVRRRARRRSGDENRGGNDDPANTVVKVRQPRQPELITEPQRVKGSTRLEAKKQRRRDGRDAGRRRTVITEAEFLARRESVDRTMVVRSKAGRIQIGVLEDGVLVEHYVARNQDASLIGNVYLGRVQNVLPSMEAAFVDIGRGRNAVLYSGEVDWDAAAENGEKNQPRRIELALKPGDKVLVQVTKDPVGHKGARLTSQVSLPGRYLVYVPNGSMNGISRKLPDTERARLKKILKEVLPDNNGVIVRTAAEGATEEQLTLDVNRLIAQWSDIDRQVGSVGAPALLHSEPDLLIKIVRDVFNEDFQKMVIEGDDARETIEAYLRAVAPDLLERIERYEGNRDSFDEFRVSEQIEKALDRKVWLPSGGSLVIDRTEAMTVVDVNTGKFVGSGGNLEETVTKNNLEAAEEIVRQLRLRDIGGIIVVDFIDMVLETNRDLVLRRLVECLSRDRTKHQVAEVTSLGLVQMTRKKLGLGLLESFSENCEVCAGRGIIVHHDPVTRHRAAQQQTPQPSRRRGGSGNGSGNGSNGASSEAPKTGAIHGITEDAKHGLALIAASTLHHDEARHAAETTAENGESAADAQPDSSGEEQRTGEKKSRRGRRGRNSAQTDHTASDSHTREADDAVQPAASAQPASQPATPVAAEPAPVVDLPPVEGRREPAHVDRSEAAHLLDSVLESLPAPKQPGQGRPRSRRVTTAALSTTPVEPIITGGRASE